MNNQDRARIVTHARHMAYMARQCTDDKDAWSMLKERQAYLDALNSLVTCKLIKDFNIITLEVTL